MSFKYCSDYMEKISVIISVFNIKLDELNTLEELFLSQTIGFENIEIILVDNNSTQDYSKTLIQTFGNEFKNVKCIFLDKNYNKILSYIKGLDFVTSKYVIFYDYHELLVDNAYELLYNEISKKNMDVVIGNNKNFNANENLISNNSISSIIYSTDFIRGVSFENCVSQPYFNYLIYSSTDKVGFLKEQIIFSKKSVIINSKKLNILKKVLKKQFSDLTIAIKTPNPTSEKHWGDYFFALSLKKSFQKKGFNVFIQEREFWNDDEDKIDIVLVLRGLIEYNPNPNHLNLMWNISHPNDIKLEEYEKYDYVFIASNEYAKEINEKITTNVNPLLQCTDTELFFPLKNDDYAEDILFVGITRGIFRQIIKDISQTNHDFSVYGYGWEKYIDKKFIKGSFIQNNVLNQAYSSCKILLNDHWGDMIDHDFPSNRLFDALACGTFVISDNIKSANELFEGTIVTYDSVEDLDKKIKYFLNNDAEREYLAKKGQELVLRKHTFDNRVDEILDTISEYSFNQFVYNVETSVNSIETDNNQYNDLRIIIIDNNDSDLISKSVNSIRDISSKIPISVINLVNFTKNKFILNKSTENFIFNSLNEILNTSTENFILIIESGDIIKKELIKKFNEINVNEYDDIGAIIFDDYTTTSNFKLGFSLDLYLETDYINYSTLLNRKAVLDINGFDKEFPHNYIRKAILELYKKECKILKEDIIGIEIKNNLKINSLKEDSLLLNNFLMDKDHDLWIDYENNNIFPVYNTNCKASIIIPFKDKVELTKQCVESILDKTNYKNFELILVDNNSYEEKTFEFLSEISKHEKCKVIKYENEFNWSKINNFASTKATGDVLVFLNNDTEVISKDWLSLLVGDVIQPGVGAVGSKLLYPDNTIQHAGVVIGLTYLAGHIFAKESEDNIPNMYNQHRRNVSSVTGACVAFKKEVFNKIGKFDENFEISFSDVEICLRAMEMGYRNIFNPQSILYHHEMKSRGTGDFREIDRILAYNVFKEYLENGDPFFNENYSLNSNNLTIKKKDEIPKYTSFWRNLNENRENHLKSIENAKKKIYTSKNDEIITPNISKTEIINNLILMKNFSKNPNITLNNVLWFLPIDDSKSNIEEIFRFAELLSLYENTSNYFIFNSDGNQEIKFKNMINKFNDINAHFITLNQVINENMTFDAALCTDCFTAYNLAKFNQCRAKFYFLQTQNRDSNINNLENMLIEQSYKFNFIGLTNSISLLDDYKKFNSNIKYFKPTVNQDIFFPCPDEKLDQMTIVLQGENSNDVCFELEIEILKFMRTYFGDKINLIYIGKDLSEYNLNKITNLIKVGSDEELSNIYRRAHICLMLSFDRMLPEDALKCLACGCALITNKNKNNSWLLKQKENAILTEPTLDCIMEDMVNLVNDFKLRERIINNGFRTIEKHDEKKKISEIIDFMKMPINIR